MSQHTRPAASPRSASEDGPSSPPRIEADPSVVAEAAAAAAASAAMVAHDLDDGDSALGMESYVPSTPSLSDSILNYRRLHGRTYENFKTTDYWAPNDDQQNEGLDIIHNALLMMLDDELFLAPVGSHPGRVLDVGTGTGIWAIDFGDQFPATEVVGTDLSPIQPPWVPPNVEFLIDDCLLDWTWPADHFDFVHMRALYGSIPDWRQLYRKAYRHLKPGGWIQDLEMDVRIESDHVEFPADHVFNRWADLFCEGGEKMGRPFAVTRGHTMRDNLVAAGFVDVVERKIKAPMHGWPRDPRLQQAGLLFQLALDESLEGFGLFVLTQVMGWEREDVAELVEEYRGEMRKRSNCGWCQTTIVYGRKPFTMGET
ncbi:hypothetical protein ACJZ2D_005663 [Fusarium nematophilum]